MLGEPFLSSDIRVMGLRRGIEYAKSVGLDEREVRRIVLEVAAWSERAPNPFSEFMG